MQGSVDPMLDVELVLGGMTAITWPCDKSDRGLSKGVGMGDCHRVLCGEYKVTGGHILDLVDERQPVFPRGFRSQLLFFCDCQFVLVLFVGLIVVGK
jgi:hypothetical protein